MATYYTVVGDTAPIQDILQNSAGVAVNLTGATAVFQVVDRFGVLVMNNTDVTNWDGAALDTSGQVQIIPGATDYPLGTFFAAWVVTFEDGEVETWSNDGTRSFLNVSPALET